MKVDLKSITQNYIEQKQKTFEELMKAASEVADFKTVPFNYHKLEKEDLKQYNINQVIYFFRITNLSKGLPWRICEEVIKLKKNNKIKYKLPLVNEDNAKGAHSNNKILYVGKSSGNFSLRLVQHLSRESEKTYALHLKRWADNPLLKTVQLELWFTVVDTEKYDLRNKKEKLAFVELLESALHLHLKPIMGRTGH